MLKIHWPLSTTAIVGLLLSVFVIGLDLWTKKLAIEYLEYAQPLVLLPVFNFTLQFNAGAAFSFLSDAGGWQRWFFSAIAAFVSSVLVVWLLRLKPEQKLLAASLSLIVAGALGNLWDRLTLGYVVDFISLHYENYYFPTFNIADSAISMGAGMLVLDAFLHPNEE